MPLPSLAPAGLRNFTVRPLYSTVLTDSAPRCRGSMGMPRRSQNRDRDQNLDPLDDLAISTPESRHSASPAVVNRAPRRTTGLADLRRWDPAPTVAREATGRPARIIHASPRQRRFAAAGKALSPRPKYFGGYAPASFRFETGGKLPICVRRTKRRQVLFALRKQKSGKGSPKKRNRWSSISCGTS